MSSLQDTYNEFKSLGVSELRSKIRELGYKGTFIVRMNKKQCIYGIHQHNNGSSYWQNDINSPDFEQKFQGLEQKSTQQKEIKMTANDNLAQEMALLIQKHSSQGISEDRVREIIQSEVKGLAPREIKLEIPNFEPKTIGLQHQNFEKLLKVLSSGGNAFLVGEAGSGKTTGGFNVADALGLKYGLVACNEMTDSFNFVGYNDANGKYVPGVAYDLYKNGGVLIVDEMEKGGANAMTSLNAMLANDRFEFPNNEIVVKHDDFKCVACGNTYGRGASRQYVGANELDASTLDRFDVLEWDIDDNLEMGIASDKDWCKLVQSCREAVRSFEGTIQLIVSMRATLRGEKLLQMGFEHREVFEMLVYKGLDANSKLKIAEKSAEIAKDKFSNGGE